MEVKECQESGLTVKEWCKIKGIHFSTYYKHLQAVRNAVLEIVPGNNDLNMLQNAPKPHFAEISLEETLLNTAEKTTFSGTTIVVHLNGAAVEIPDGVCEKYISTVLRVIKTI